MMLQKKPSSIYIAIEATDIGSDSLLMTLSNSNWPLTGDATPKKRESVCNSIKDGHCHS